MRYFSGSINFFLIFNIFSRFKTVSPTEREFFLKKIRGDPTFKGAMGRPLMKVIYLNQISSSENFNKICKDVFMTIPVVIFSKKDFYLLDKLNHLIGIFQASGLIDFWHYENVDKKIIVDKTSKVATILTFNQLLSCFQILLLGYFLSFVVFIVEASMKIILILSSIRERVVKKTVN